MPKRLTDPLSSDVDRPSAGTSLVCRGNASCHLSRILVSAESLCRTLSYLHFIKRWATVTPTICFHVLFLHPFIPPKHKHNRKFFGCGTPGLAVCCPACSVMWELTFVEHWAQLGNTLRHQNRELASSEGRCKMFRNQKTQVCQVPVCCHQRMSVSY